MNENELFNDNGLVLICQGTTDIINQFGLIKYYCKLYKKLYLFSLPIHKHLLTFYLKDENIEIIYFDNEYNVKENLFSYVNKNYEHLLVNDFLFHGWYDRDRNDKYKNKFEGNWIEDSYNFVNMFYSSYDIDISVRIDYFIFDRDHELENRTYDNFVQEHGDKYILYHSNDNDNFIINKKDYKYINLNKKSDTFFDYIKILENAHEIHVIDSSWAAFIYLLDCKYRLFKDKQIYLYPLRNYKKMFQEPIQLDNWVFM
jgi:hypothetical protein